jgi:hypothetical protein
MMPFLNSLAQRRLQPELIDLPDLEPCLHAAALRGLERINWWSGSARILWPPIRYLLRAQRGRPLRLLDIATGAGDVPIGLFHKARWAGLALQLEGCDCSPQAVAHAQQQATRQNAQVRFFVHDALCGDLPKGYDVLTSSLFLHHLEEEHAISLLRRMGQAARYLLLINDLERSRSGFALAWIGTRLLTASPVVHTDGPRSVEGAFTLPEVQRLATSAGLEGFGIRRRWPCRYLLTWSRPGGAPA